jgi:iron(III) transport system substrate-binding protein
MTIRMTLSPRARFFGVALGVTLMVAGCAAASEETPAPEPEAPAVEEAVVPVSDNYVILYSGREETLVQPLIDRFTEQTGIQVDVRYAGTSELAAQLLEEGAQTPAGVFFSQDAGALGAMTEAGLFAPLPEETTSRVQAEFSSTDSSWVGVSGRARVIVYDSETVAAEDLPQDVDDLVGPEWSGQLAVAPGNASFQSFVTAYRVLRGEDAADQWVSGLGINDPQIFEKNGAILEAVNDGVLPLGLINHYYWHRLVAERGIDNMRAQLHFTAPGDPASIVNVTGAGVLKAHAADLDAFTLVAFLVSDEAQRYFVENTFEYPLVPGIEEPEGVPALSSLVVDNLDLSDLSSLEQTQSLLQKYGLIL